MENTKNLKSNKLLVNTHTMGLNPNALELIKSGMKTIEMRLNDDKRQKILIGDYIVFVSTEDESKTLKTKVIELYKYKSFYDLYKNFSKIELGYNKNDIANHLDMEIYYNKEDIEKYGVLGIQIDIV